MSLFSWLAPSVNQGAMNQQTTLAEQALQALKQGQKKAIGAIDTGTTQAQPSFQEAVDLFKGVTQGRQGATDMYYNSLGLNGLEGNQTALDAFQQGPGYQFALDQANQNVLRNSAATGGVASGGTLQGLSDRAQQLQNLEYGNWQNRLQNLDVLPAAQGQAGQLQNLGNLFANAGTNKASVYTGMAPAIAGQYNNQAGLIGQQQMMGIGAQQQGISNALGLLGGLGAFFGA